jgi:hypothetical protein
MFCCAPGSRIGDARAGHSMLFFRAAEAAQRIRATLRERRAHHN